VFFLGGGKGLYIYIHNYIYTHTDIFVKKEQNTHRAGMKGVAEKKNVD
jgi:hypothetical protein